MVAGVPASEVWTVSVVGGPSRTVSSESAANALRDQWSKTHGAGNVTVTPKGVNYNKGGTVSGKMGKRRLDRPARQSGGKVNFAADSGKTKTTGGTESTTQKSADESSGAHQAAVINRAKPARATGGSVNKSVDMDAGAGGGLGRIEKTKKYGDNA